MTKIVNALQTLGKEYGMQKIDPNADISEVILELAGSVAFGSSNVTPSSPTASKEYWGTKVSAMQTSLTVANGAITGTLHKLTSGALVTDWGEGYFMALKFVKNNDRITSIKVGLDPSVSSGLVELDADMDGVFKITDKDVQKFVIVCSDGSVSYTMEFDLSGLTLADS